MRSTCRVYLYLLEVHQVGPCPGGKLQPLTLSHKMNECGVTMTLTGVTKTWSVTGMSVMPEGKYPTVSVSEWATHYRPPKMHGDKPELIDHSN
jgi:hypothetical protein